MTMLWRVYSDAVAARRAVEALRAADVPGRDIRLLTGSRLHDVRDEPVGEFARAAGPSAPVGTFANLRRVRRQGAGSFAGDSDRQRQGSFADAERDVIITYEHGAGRARVTGDQRVRRLLHEAGLDRAAARRVVDELHAGHAVVLADVAQIAPRDARARLEHVAHAG